MQDLKILYRDDHFVAVDKPVGMLVHRTKLAKGVRRIAVQQLWNQLGQQVFSLHRLDRPTSGVLLFALDQNSAREVSELFEQHQVEKTYVALTRGHCPSEGTIDVPLVEMFDKTTDVAERKDKEPQQAVTDYRCLQQVVYPHPVGRYETARYSLVQLSPQTGRRHQIRRHLKHINYPIIGDRKHGDRDHNAFFKEHFEIDRMLLVAKRLRFVHPVTNEKVEIDATLGEPFLRVLSQLGFETTVDAKFPCD